MANILVVDDEPEIVRLVAKIMVSRGHTVSIARDGQEALERVAESPPHVVILDLNIPKIDGFEVCRRIKADEKTRGVAVVMLTAAYPRVEDAADGVHAGAD